MLTISRLIKFFLILLFTNNLYAAVNPNEAYGKSKPRKKMMLLQSQMMLGIFS